MVTERVPAAIGHEFEVRKRNALIHRASIEIHDLSQTVRTLIGAPSANPKSTAARALLVRIEVLAAAMLFMSDPVWGKTLDEIAEIVNSSNAVRPISEQTQTKENA